MAKDEIILPLRITLVAPTTGVAFCLQEGPGTVVDRAVSTGKDLSFDLSVRVKRDGADGPPRFLGPFTQGPPAQRFVYICSGTMASQPDSCWTRRAKIGLTKITWPLIESVAAGLRLEARFKGAMKDGSPACASLPFLDDGWRWVKE